MTGILLGTPKYACSNCGKLFTRQKGLYRHTSKNRCRGGGARTVSSQGQGKAMALSQIEYHGREYNFNAIPTGNRHLRTGIPLPRFNIGMRTPI